MNGVQVTIFLQGESAGSVHEISLSAEQYYITNSSVDCEPGFAGVKMFDSRGRPENPGPPLLMVAPYCQICGY